jgi:hypothetical protein
VIPEVGQWITIWVVAVVLNTIPAFMPPTWSLLAFVHVRHGLPLWPLAAVGAAAAITGRALLVLGSRLLDALRLVAAA